MYHKKIYESKGNVGFKQIWLDPISRQSNRILISVNMNYSKAKPTITGHLYIFYLMVCQKTKKKCIVGFLVIFFSKLGWQIMYFKIMIKRLYVPFLIFLT